MTRSYLYDLRHGTYITEEKSAALLAGSAATRFPFNVSYYDKKGRLARSLRRQVADIKSKSIHPQKVPGRCAICAHGKIPLECQTPAHSMDQVLLQRDQGTCGQSQHPKNRRLARNGSGLHPADRLQFSPSITRYPPVHPVESSAKPECHQRTVVHRV